MPEAILSTEVKSAVVTNIFALKDPSKQQELLDVLSEGAESVIQHRDGFVSATLLASADGATVTNIAVWESPDAAKATFADPEAQKFAAKAADLATPTPGFNRVAAIVAK